MIGNDIVDLQLAKTESNWQRKGFLDKIFTQAEQEYIFKSNNPELMVWNLWSRKEAAYKIWNRKSKVRIFNPSQFKCLHINEPVGIVRYLNNYYKTKTIQNKQFIYTIAIDQSVEFEMIKETSNLTISKENDIPYLLISEKEKKIISITHHGRFKKIITI